MIHALVVQARSIRYAVADSHSNAFVKKVIKC